MPASDLFFGLKLKELRAAAGLSQKALAEKAGLALTTVAALEQGVYDATWPTVRALSTALSVDCRAFASTDEKPPKAAAKKGRGRPKKAD
ncbi:hypothetical protein BH11PLA2_BH11PLA2_23320 [soil metagenome]